MEQCYGAIIWHHFMVQHYGACIMAITESVRSYFRSEIQRYNDNALNIELTI